MTQQEIIEGNERIAQFMGVQSVEDGRGGIYYPSPLDGRPSELKYHLSWDWLMPVVEMICAGGTSAIHLDAGCSFLHYGGQCESFYDEETGSKISSVYAAVIQYLNYRNQ